MESKVRKAEVTTLTLREYGRDPAAVAKQGARTGEAVTVVDGRGRVKMTISFPNPLDGVDADALR